MATPGFGGKILLVNLTTKEIIRLDSEQYEMFGGGHGTTCDPFYQYCGAVFELSPPKKKGGKWTEKVLHGFRGGRDGANPNGGLVFDTTGAIYGTTYSGGNQECKFNDSVGCGTAFELAPPAKPGQDWIENVITRFGDALDAGEPSAGLVFDSDGRLYGTTLGGSGGWGTIFRLDPKPNGGWKGRILYSFHDNDDGCCPRAALTVSAAGDFYGSATGGGVSGGGTVFRLRKAHDGQWEFAILYAFAGTPDGSYPTGPLIFDRDGNLYGTAQESGSTGPNCGHTGCGTVYRLSP